MVNGQLISSAERRGRHRRHDRPADTSGPSLAPRARRRALGRGRRRPRPGLVPAGRLRGRVPLIFNNNIRAGYSAPSNNAFDARDDNFNTFDIYPFDRAVGATPLLNIGETYDYYDATGSIALPVERIRRFVTPIDLAGDGQVITFNQFPHHGPRTASTAATSFGRVELLPATSGPPGVPLPTGFVNPSTSPGPAQRRRRACHTCPPRGTTPRRPQRRPDEQPLPRVHVATSPPANHRHEVIDTPGGHAVGHLSRRPGGAPGDQRPPRGVNRADRCRCISTRMLAWSAPA